MPNKPKDLAISVFLRKPSASLLKCRFDGMGNGGRGAPVLATVMMDHVSKITTITVVICITRRALSLDSSMPMMFCHQ